VAGTRAFDLIDYIVTSLQAGTGLCAPGGLTVPVYDGPVSTQYDPNVYVVVGNYGFADEDEIPEITVDAQWASLPIGAGHRSETISVPCVVVAWSGGQDWSATRGEVASAFDAVSTVLMTKSTWDGLSDIDQIIMTNVRLTQTPTDLGIQVMMTFDVDATFRV
jgi:hypothetical protein